MGVVGSFKRFSLSPGDQSDMEPYTGNSQNEKLLRANGNVEVNITPDVGGEYGAGGIQCTGI